MVAYKSGGLGAAGSNPVIPTKLYMEWSLNDFIKNLKNTFILMLSLTIYELIGLIRKKVA